MNQLGNTDENNFDPSADRYMASVYAFKQQISELSEWINFTPYWEIASDYEKVAILELEIADIIHNLELLSGNPLGRRFNKKDVLRHLSNARIEINIASRLAGASDPQTQTLCFQHIATCRDYLNLAIVLMV